MTSNASMGVVGPVSDLSSPGASLGQRAGLRIRLLHAGRGGARAQATDERRRAQRLAPGDTRWSDGALLRPGYDARVLDIGPSGARLELATRPLVGGRVELSLIDQGAQLRLDLTGIVRRCTVVCLDPLVFHGAVEFDTLLEPSVLKPFLPPDASQA